MDELLLRALNGLSAHPAIHTLSVALSSRLMIPIVCGPLALWLFKRRRFSVILSVALAMGTADLITARIMKPFFARERPCRAIPGLVKSARCGAGRSFPSGHATVAFAFLTSAAPAVPHGWVVFAPLAAGVALSRVTLGVHYPSDIGAGALLGALLGWLAVLWRRRFDRRRSPPQAKEEAEEGG